MDPFVNVTGVAVPLGRRDVDTDLIIPSRFMKTVSRRGLGAGAFAALREDPANLFDQPRYRGAPFLIAGANFGCGSSREHAVWALLDLGVRVIIAPSFADIFAGNAFKNGMLLVELAQAQVDDLIAQAAHQDFAVDLVSQTISTPVSSHAFAIDAFRKHCLLDGVDEIELTEAQRPEIEAFRLKAFADQPWRLPRSIAAKANADG